MNYSKELYKNKGIRQSVMDVLYQQQYNAGEKYGHTGGVIFSASRVVFYIACIYTALLTLTYALGSAFFLNGGEPGTDFNLLTLVLMSAYTLMLIAAVILISKRFYILASLLGLTGGLLPLYIFKNLLHAYNMEHAGEHAIFGDTEVMEGISYGGQNKNAFVIAVVFSIILIIIGAFVQYNRKINFLAPIIAALFMVTFLIWQITAPMNFFGAGFSIFHLIALFLMPGMLLILAARMYSGKNLYHGIFYVVSAAVMILLMWDIFREPVAAMMFDNFYLRHGLAALLIFISAVYIFVTYLLDSRRVTKELDLISEKIYADVSTEDKMLTPEEWDKAIKEYITKIYNKK